MQTITYTTHEHTQPQTGTILKVYEPGKYLVKEQNPTPGQPTTRFVFSAQVRSISNDH